MNRFERAAQIWPLLALSARNRQVLTYDLVGDLIGVPRQGLGQLLEPIQSYCILGSLPALSSLVVGASSGSPGEGFIASSDVPQEQARVFARAWPASPTPAQFEEAAIRLPSNGASLSQLLSVARGVSA